eukprot:GEMP01101056.1.p1 GENE.GEMP01101056.1~~GEMP01101056.1.p1  ORF type:complete len:138 (+),score=20.98 GEMP01101056.1:165-578(+)
MLKLNRAMIAAKAAGDGLPERSTAVPLTSKGMSTKIMAPPRHRPTDEMREQRRFAAWTRMTVPPKIQKKSADNAPVGSVVRMLQAHQDQLESKCWIYLWRRPLAAGLPAFMDLDIDGALPWGLDTEVARRQNNRGRS